MRISAIAIIIGLSLVSLPLGANAELEPTAQQNLPYTPALDPTLPPLPEIHPHPEPMYGALTVEQLEYRLNEGHDTLNWEAEGWYGGDYRRLRLKTEGEVELDGDGGELEVQLLYSQLVSPFWEVEGGLRYDREFGNKVEGDRFFGAIGIQGLAPYFVETEATLFVSEAGDVSARFKAERDFLISQRLILQPEIELNLAVQSVENFGVGSGLNDIDFGLRLRYEITRQFAPYVGVNWTHKFGQTADFARREGEQVDNWAVVGGVRLLF